MGDAGCKEQGLVGPTPKPTSRILCLRQKLGRQCDMGTVRERGGGGGGK